MGKTFLVLMSNIVFLVFTVAGHIVLIPLWKEMGAAVSMSISTTITTVLTMILLVERQKGVLGRFLSVFGRSTVPLFGLFLLVELTQPNVVFSVLYYAVFVFVLYCLKVITWRDIKILAFHIFDKPGPDNRTDVTQNAI